MLVWLSFAYFAYNCLSQVLDKKNLWLSKLEYFGKTPVRLGCHLFLPAVSDIQKTVLMGPDINCCSGTQASSFLLQGGRIDTSPKRWMNELQHYVTTWCMAIIMVKWHYLPVIRSPSVVCSLRSILFFCASLYPSLSLTLFSHSSRYGKNSFSSHCIIVCTHHLISSKWIYQPNCFTHS